MRYVPLDFERGPLAPALASAGFDREQCTCVVWESVFSYLTPEAIDVTLAALVQLCAPGSQILLTYVDERALDDRGARHTPGSPLCATSASHFVQASTRIGHLRSSRRAAWPCVVMSRP